MAYDRTAPLHAYDHERISCACGGHIGYRPARSGEQLRCRDCEQPYAAPPLSAAPVDAAAAQALLDAWDHARARSLTGDSSVAIPIALCEAIDDARKALEPAG